MHELDDPWDGAEARRQRDRRRSKTGARRLVKAEVRTAESIDRLLRVPDDEQPPRLRWREQLDDLELQRVGVLELVDEEVPITPPELRSDGLVASHEVAGPNEQVMEAELAPDAPHLGRVDR